jgi:hypothetical protein
MVAINLGHVVVALPMLAAKVTCKGHLQCKVCIETLHSELPMQ